MIDLSRIEQYRESNRIEAKKATGGLPESIWETYSAFANTLGGVILLGVEEDPNRILHPVDLPDPEWLVEEFWALINDPKTASVNILKDKDVQIKDIEGKQIIIITVPQASPAEKPVYIYGDMRSGTYCRQGDGDYRCTPDEIRRMQTESGL